MRIALLVPVVVAAVWSLAVADAEDKPPLWSAGPYLMLDDTLVAEQEGVRSEILQPARLPEPIVTGYEDGCFQPYVTVVRDPRTRRFRMWYNVPASPGNTGESRLAYLESEDGIHWIRPHRILDTPPIQFGTSVIDEGPDYPDPAWRYKFAWWKNGGLQVAGSPDGLTWTALAPGVVLATNHDITAIEWDPLRNRYMALVSQVPTEGPFKGLRIPHQSVSSDLVRWKQPPWPIVTPDPSAAIEKGETQFYGMSGVVVRGGLLVSMVKVLRDDLNCERGRTARELHDDSGRRFAGLGYSVVAWSHDGEHWKRESRPFLDRNPQPGTWDRAMAWADDQLVIGDFTYIYYGGYRWGHKAERFTGRQIGFAQMPRDRYAGLSAGRNGGRVLTRSGVLRAARVTVNARINQAGGELRMRLVQGKGKVVPGFDWDDCEAIRGDRVEHPVRWKGDLRRIQGASPQFEFRVVQGTLYGFDLH